MGLGAALYFDEKCGRDRVSYLVGESSREPQSSFVEGLKLSLHPDLSDYFQAWCRAFDVLGVYVSVPPDSTNQGAEES
jgi:hypothetical protein